MKEEICLKTVSFYPVRWRAPQVVLQICIEIKDHTSNASRDGCARMMMSWSLNHMISSCSQLGKHGFCVVEFCCSFCCNFTVFHATRCCIRCWRCHCTNTWFSDRNNGHLCMSRRLCKAERGSLIQTPFSNV